MTETPASSLPQLLDTIAGELRGISMRVERADDTTLEGIYEPQRRSPAALSLFMAETQTYVEIPHDDVRRVWLPHVVPSRRLLYLTVTITLGVLAGVVPVQLTGSSALPGVLIGIATSLTVMLAAWLPPIRDWMVIWQPRYNATDAR